MQAETALTQRLLTPRIAAYGVLFALLIAFGAYFFSAYDAPILGWMQDNQQWFQDKILAYPLWGAIGFTLLFALVLGFYIPGGIVLMLMVGAIFPVWEANVIANLGNLLGATIGFFLSRYLLRDEVQSCYGDRLCRVNNGIRKNGWLYLVILRIAPVLPSPVVNLSMGLTPMKTGVYMAATLIGRIPMTALYVNMGAELGEIEHMSELVSLEFLGSLILVGALLLAGHFALQRCEAKS
jgi:uncharacterized membrane protein YdjX (TVP38/TMEM64 family)